MNAHITFIRKLGGLIALLASASFARATNFKPLETGFGDRKELEGAFLHLVFFWLVYHTVKS